ncbi:MAG: transposase family protein [Saprospiraceae bacterium]|nr:transposase family protein [Candidatus Vicinibacter affinis]
MWWTDITYIPMAKGFMYMIAFLDVYSRKIMGWSISNSMSKQWGVAALKKAIAANGKPKIINSDQGSQFTSAMWTQYLESENILISMDGKGRTTDNTRIERFWKTLNTIIFISTQAIMVLNFLKEFKNILLITTRKSIKLHINHRIKDMKNQLKIKLLNMNFINLT